MSDPSKIKQTLFEKAVLHLKQYKSMKENIDLFPEEQKIMVEKELSHFSALYVVIHECNLHDEFEKFKKAKGV